MKGENHRSTQGNVKRFPKAEYGGLALVDTPLADISNSHLAAFAQWVIEEKGGKNYRNLNNSLLHVITLAAEEGKNNQRITFKPQKHAPKKISIKTETDDALTLDQFREIEALRGAVVNPDGHRNKQLQALFLDAALLLYYTSSRPADVLLFNWDMVEETAKGTKVLRYIPFKKRTYNNATEHTVTVPLSPEALAIMEKYKGQSAGGYLLPLPLNETRWDITTKDDYAKWQIKSKKTLGRINAHLKKVGERINLPFPLDMYTFRRSAITHKVNNGGNIAMVAKRAGTSVAMLSKHYYKDNDL